MSDTQAKPRRRWLSFRLRTLLVLITICTLPMAWVAKERQKSQTQLELAQRFQQDDRTCVIVYDAANDTWNWRQRLPGKIRGLRVISFESASSDLRDLAPLVAFENLAFLKLSTPQVSDITPVAELTDLVLLIIDSTQVSDITPIAGLTNLVSLKIRASPVRDITPLAGLNNMVHLDLRRTQVRDIAPLAVLKDLLYLDLRDTLVTKDQIEALQKALPKCRIVHDGYS